jgi:hypothetical protein
MGGGTKAVEPNLFAFASDHQRTPADEAGAEQRGERHVAAGLAERERKARIGDRRRREAAIASKPGEERVIAEIFLAARAIGTDTAGVAKPRNPNALTHPQALDASPDLVDPSNDLMAWDDRQLRVRQLAIDDMQVRAAYAAGGHL